MQSKTAIPNWTNLGTPVPRKELHNLKAGDPGTDPDPGTGSGGSDPKGGAAPPPVAG